MSDVVRDLLTALNKQAISKIKLVTLKNRRGDAEGEPVTHSEIFDAKFKNYMGRHDQQMHTTLFNLANPSQGRGSKRDAEYMRLAQNPEKNRQQLQLMVDAAANAAGYTSPLVYHGSVAKGITEFNVGKAVEVEGGIFFSTDNDVASQYTFERAYGDIISDEPLGDVTAAKLQIQNPYEYTARGKIVDAYEMQGVVNSAKTKGHDGVIIKNIDDSIGMTGQISDVYVVFNGNQIKSADPITRDNKGNVIPLSSRFNVRSPLVAEKRSDVPERVLAATTSNQGGVTGTGINLKLTKQQAKDILADIETGRGRIAVVAKDNPSVREASQESVRSRHGNTVTLYRVVQVQEGKQFRDDATVSTTDNFKSAISIQGQQPGALITPKTWINLTPTFVAYQVPVNRVVADVGMLAQSAAKSVGSLKSISGGRGKVSIETILSAAKKEKEIVADLSGVKPTFILPITNNAQRMLLTEYALGNKITSIGDAISILRKSNIFFDGSKDAAQILQPVIDFLKLVSLVPLSATTSKERVLATISEATLKNYMGRHDQQMHTTLFNLANPSQGRGSRGAVRGEEVRELTGPTAPTRTATAMSAAESRMSAAEYNFNFLLQTEAKIEQNIKLAQLIISYEREIREELSRTKENIVEHAQGILERTGYRPNPDLSDIKQLWAQRISTYKQRAEIAIANAKAKPNDEGLQRLAESYRKIHAANHAIKTLLYRDDKIALPEKQEQARDDWSGRFTRNPLKKLSWDGNTTSYEIPQYGRSSGPADKFVLGGAKTKEFTRKVAKELGIPPAFLKFARDQPIGNPDTLADYRPRTNLVTVYPLLIGTNATTNSKQAIRGALGHEAAHMRYASVSLAVRTATTPASSRDLWFREGVAERAFGDKTAGSLRQAGFLGSRYEVKMLKAVTDPTSVFRVGKDGLPKAKRGYEEYLALFKTDGITDYSASFWKAFSTFPSEQRLKLAINETLAEVTRLTELGHRGKISTLWRDASDLLNSTYGKIGSPWTSVLLDMDIPIKIKFKSEYGNVKFPAQSIIDALRGLVDKYQADKSAKIAAANPPPEKYTSKSLKNLTKQHGLLSTKLLRVALKNTEGKKMKMIILGQTGESILVVDSGQNLDSALAKGFILDLDEQKATSVGVAQSYKYVPWVEPDANLKIPKWFTGKSTPPITLSRDELDHIRVYLEGDHIDLNELLRNNSKPSQKQNKVMDALDKAIIVYGTTDYEELYGAIPDLSAANLGLIEGLKFKDYGMQSAYDNMESARALLDTNITTNNGTLIKYTTRDQKRRKLIDMKFMGEENEFLFPRNTIFTVVELQRSQDDRYDIVTMDAAY